MDVGVHGGCRYRNSEGIVSTAFRDRKTGTLRKHRKKSRNTSEAPAREEVLGQRLENRRNGTEE